MDSGNVVAALKKDACCGVFVEKTRTTALTCSSCGQLRMSSKKRKRLTLAR